MSISESDEYQLYLNLIFKNLKSNKGFFVDIGASNGISFSNTYHLANNPNWSGLSIEYDSIKYTELLKNQPREEITKEKVKITVDNVIEVFKKNNVPETINFLSIDIDGYDYYVLDKILSNYNCEVIIAEINEKIPPPITFTVEYDPNYWWGCNHFYGMSLSQLNLLTKIHPYTITDYIKCNAIMVNNNQLDQNYIKKSIQTLYDEGYRLFEHVQPSYNDDVKHWLFLSPEEAIEEINKTFKNFSRYRIGILKD